MNVIIIISMSLVPYVYMIIVITSTVIIVQLPCVMVIHYNTLGRSLCVITLLEGVICHAVAYWEILCIIVMVCFELYQCYM